MTIAALMVIGFVVGSILGGQIVARLFSAGPTDDDYGVLSAIAQNGPVAGVLVAVIDIAKAALLLVFLPSLLGAEQLTDWLPFSLGLSLIFGHIFSPWAKFSGGKPVAVLLGCMAVLMPFSVLLWAAVWVVTAVVSRYASLASLMAAGSLPLFAVLAGSSVADRPMLGFALVALAMTIFSHRPNIRAMQVGSEPTLSLSSLKRSEGAGES